MLTVGTFLNPQFLGVHVDPHMSLIVLSHSYNIFIVHWGDAKGSAMKPISFVGHKPFMLSYKNTHLLILLIIVQSMSWLCSLWMYILVISAKYAKEICAHPLGGHDCRLSASIVCLGLLNSWYTHVSFTSVTSLVLSFCFFSRVCLKNMSDMAKQP